MSRAISKERLQSHRFWLLDVAPIDALSLPVLTPQFGFSSISSPEIQVETQEIKEGNWPFATHVVKGASISPLTAIRGSTFTDSDFWRWITATILGDVEALQSPLYGAAKVFNSDLSSGNQQLRAFLGAAALTAGLFGIPRIGGQTPRRDMILVQFWRPRSFEAFSGDLLGELLIGANAVGLFTSVASSFLEGGGIAAAAEAALSAANGSNILTNNIPARAWMLRGCLPIRYKTSSDFDATSDAVSLMEVEIQPSEIEEISLTS